MWKRGKKRSLSPEKWTQIVTLSSLKISVRQIEKKPKVSKTQAVHNAIMKYQNEGTFEDSERSCLSRFTSSKDDLLMHKEITRSLISSSKKFLG